MMEAPSMLPYDSRPTTTTPLQRPVMAPQYMVAGSYNSGPMPNLTAPPYQPPNPYQFGGYHSPPTPPHLTSFKQEYHDRRPMGPQSDNGRLPAFPRDTKPLYEEHPHSPPPRSNSQASTTRSATNPILAAKTITSNETINPNDQVNFETEVDELMKAIQKKRAEAAHQLPTPGMSPASEASLDAVSQPSPASTASVQGDTKASRKRYICNGPNCNKSFTQKTHLDIHRRTHTGDKPYVCNYPNCNLTFSQLGNLKTHMRRHTGERPFPCPKCGRSFAQRGNVRAHLQTHEGIKPFVCKLDDCNKTFSQLGNMKTHQNNFHKKTLKTLTTKFAQIISSGDEVPEADRELFDYFAEHYKNSNKGIKGRGKARTVAERKGKSASHSPATSPTSIVQYPLPQIPHLQQTPLPHHHQHHGLTHPGSLAAYSVSRQHHIGNGMARHGHHDGYEMFEMDGDHHSVQPPNNNSMMYEDHARHMAFTERLY